MNFDLSNFVEVEVKDYPEVDGSESVEVANLPDAEVVYP